MFPIMVIKPTRSVRVCKRERETETESLGGWVMGGVKLFSCHQTRVFVLTGCWEDRWSSQADDKATFLVAGCF